MILQQKYNFYYWYNFNGRFWCPNSNSNITSRISCCMLVVY